MNNPAAILQSVSIIVTCLTVILGVHAWKREFIGRRRIEMAEEVLMKFYQARDAISRIRSPLGYVGEGRNRKRREGESPAASEVLDRAYVVVERYEKEEALFSNLHALRYQVMARLSVDAAKPFDELRTILNEIFFAAQMLGSHYWQRQGMVPMTEAERESHLNGMFEKEAIFWAGYEKPDKIAVRVDAAIADIEKVFRPLVEERRWRLS
jgi:hypothetical protein